MATLVLTVHLLYLTGSTSLYLRTANLGLNPQVLYLNRSNPSTCCLLPPLPDYHACYYISHLPLSLEEWLVDLEHSASSLSPHLRLNHQLI